MKEANLVMQGLAFRKEASMLDVPAAMIIGVFGMAITLFGIEINHPVFFWSGIVASVSAAGYITMKFLTAVWDFVDRIKDKRK